MSFVVALALAVAVFVAAPIFAHLLRRSRAEETEFPPARLVPAAQPVARQRSRLEDRALLSIRALMVLGLAVLGATPLVRCSRLSIARSAGGSVALAIVIDDSMSMRAKTPSGTTRWERALAGARELLGTARDGDAVAVVLAGAPARLALAATTDLTAAKRSIAELEPSDRGTDLESAVQLARSALKQLPHVDRRVVMLTDFAGPVLPGGEPELWAPLADLRANADDCGVVSAESRGRRVTVSVACSAATAARDRSIELVVGKSGAAASDAGAAAPKPKAGEVVSTLKLEPRAGEQTLSTEVGTTPIGLDARLTGSDSNPADDLAPVAPELGALTIGVVSDPATSGASTGGATIIEQAIQALGLEVASRPLPVMPEDSKELAALAAIILDDPSGIAPEARAALGEWLDRGGVAIAWLGPGAESAQLGTTLEPFARGAVRWEESKAKGIDPASLAWLGAPGSSLGDLHARGRAHIDGALPSGAKIAGRWDDGQPWLAELSLGRGLAVTVGLPVSVDESDVAIRPAFLALLEHYVGQAQRRAGLRRSSAGSAWTFPASSKVEIEGPEGPLRASEPSSVTGADAVKTAVPARAGRYRVVVDGSPEARIVTILASEVTTLPREPNAESERVVVGGVKTTIDASPEIALALLALLTLELAVRSWMRFRKNRPRRADRRQAGDSAAGA